MFDACPEIHSHGSDLNFDIDVFCISEVFFGLDNGGFYNNVITSVSVFLWVFDIIFF